MIDSVAIASIRPSWRSVASIWRVPNNMAKAAIVSATNRARSPNGGSIAPVACVVWARIALSEDETALSWSAMYGIDPMMVINATVAATAWFLP